jgi:hypothetical protein
VDSKHQKTLEAIFEKPERANILWRDVEALFIALGAEITDGNGSRRRVALKGVRAVFHRPHPRLGASQLMRYFPPLAKGVGILHYQLGDAEERTAGG